MKIGEVKSIEVNGRMQHRAVVEIDGVPFYGPIMFDAEMAEDHRARAEKVLTQSKAAAPDAAAENAAQSLSR
jgi:hypothetical protein